MSKEDFEIIIASPSYRENLVAEISFKRRWWVEISAEVPNDFVIAFFNTEEGNNCEIPYDEAIEVLEEAKNHLAKYQRTPEEQAEYEARMKILEQEYIKNQSMQSEALFRSYLPPEYDYKVQE